MFPERWLLAARLRLRSLVRKREVEQELQDELSFHVEHLVQTHIANGLHPAEARRRASLAVEGLEQKKEECRDMRGWNWLEDLGRDLRYALRMLRRSPIFTAIAILSVALGIGANSAVFSLIDTLLLRPLPVPHPAELQTIFLRMPERAQPYLSYPVFLALRTHNRAFASMAAWSNHRFQMRSSEDTVHVDGQLVTPSYFATLAVSPVQGRTLQESDDGGGGKNGPVAVISDRFWAGRYGRSPSAIGSRVVLDRVAFTVVGVMPSDFFGFEVGTHPDVWIPLSLADQFAMPGCLNDRGCWWLALMGRLKPGITERAAKAELSVVGRSVLNETVPLAWNGAWKQRYLGYSFYTIPGEHGWSFLRLQFTDPLQILMTLVALVLLVACANMANLLLARASARQHEIAIRLSIGAGRLRVIRQLLTESVLLSVAGGLVGTAFAFWLTRILIAFVSTTQLHGPGEFTRLEVQPDWRILLFTLGITFASGILFGFAPALRSTRLGVAISLKQSVQNLRGHEGRFHPGRLILSVQTALSVLLVAAAGLFAGTLFRLLTLDYGFNPDSLSLVELDTDKRPEHGAALGSLYMRILERVNAMPGVSSASLLSYVPLSRDGQDAVLRVPGRPDLDDRDTDTFINIVGPNFFDVMQTHLLSGRQFNSADIDSSERVGVLSRIAARRFFPNESPLGRYVLLDGKPIRIVGIAEDMRYDSLRDEEGPELYLPYAQALENWKSLILLTKLRTGSAFPLTVFRGVLRSIASDVPISRIYTMQQQINSSVGLERLMAALSIFFGSLALLLSSIGLYGVLAYNVTRRTGEIGIRMALGGSRTHVIWLMLRGVLAYVSAGLVVGTFAVLAVSKIVAGLLYGVRPNDGVTLVSAILTFLSVAAAAALLPSLRASRIDPASALRQE